MKVVTNIPDLVWSGDQEPVEEKFTPVKNSAHSPIGKPARGTGMWLCPITSDYRWKHWCDAEEYHRVLNPIEWVLTVRPGTRLIVIDSYPDLLELLGTYGLPDHENPYIGMTNMFSLIDFELLAQDYDGIWLTEEGQWATRLSEPSLYGWDLESVLVFRWVFDNVSVEAEVLDEQAQPSISAAPERALEETG